MAYQSGENTVSGTSLQVRFSADSIEHRKIWAP